MKAIRVTQFGPPEVLQSIEIPQQIPDPGQILVRIEAAGVNPIDTYIRSGNYGRLPELPYTPGSDGAGTVLAVGHGIQSWQPGQRVYLAGSLTGTYAEAALCTPAQIHPLPENLSFSEGAALGIPYPTAHYALFARGHAQPGETVLIHGGSGAVGQAAIQLAKAHGLHVLATAGTETGLELVTLHGADAAFDHTRLGYREAILEYTNGLGVHLIVEMLANVNLAHDLTLLAPNANGSANAKANTNGRVLVVGSRGPVEINPRDLMLRSADIRGVLLFNASQAELSSIHAELQGALRAGQIRPSIALEFPLADAAAAHTTLLTRGVNGKIVLRP